MVWQVLDLLYTRQEDFTTDHLSPSDQTKKFSMLKLRQLLLVSRQPYSHALHALPLTSGSA
jgi:hypothetical protein